MINIVAPFLKFLYLSFRYHLHSLNAQPEEEETPAAEGTQRLWEMTGPLLNNYLSVQGCFLLTNAFDSDKAW